MDEKKREKLRTLTVEFLLAVRAAYLRAGAKPMKHWEQLQSRCLSAARRAAGPEEWTTLVLRGLQIQSLDSSGSSTLRELVNGVVEVGAVDEWFRMIEREIGYLMATARGIADAKREERRA